MSRRYWVGAAIWVCAAPYANAQLEWLWGPPPTLEAMAQRLERDFPDVRHLPPTSLEAQLQARALIELYDVREADEFAVSHLNGAERVAPETATEAVLDQIGAHAQGRLIVYYCSVGQRSSRMARRTQQGLISRGAHGVYSLRGGIFAWRNEQQPLVDAWGATPYVHPYSRAWAQLLAHPEFARFEPRGAP